MKGVNPYLNFPGNTEEAFNFYKSVFGGEFTSVQRFGETPEAGNVADADKNKIMHISLPLGKANMLMGTDAVESMGYSVTTGNNIQITIDAESREEADKIYKELSLGGSKTMPMEDAFWGDYFGMLTDKFGIQWMVVHSNRQQN